jgi:hypothetical protein
VTVVPVAGQRRVQLVDVRRGVELEGEVGPVLPVRRRLPLRVERSDRLGGVEEETQATVEVGFDVRRDRTRLGAECGSAG